MLRLNPLLELRLLCCVASLEAKLSQVCRRNLRVFNSHYGLGLNWFYPDLKFQFVKFCPQCDSINGPACWIVLDIWLLQQRNSFQLLHWLTFKPQYQHTNSPNWCLYIFLKNELREFDKRSKHFLLDDHFINSHNLVSWHCMDIVRRKLMLVTIGT